MVLQMKLKNYNFYLLIGILNHKEHPHLKILYQLLLTILILFNLYQLKKHNQQHQHQQHQLQLQQQMLQIQQHKYDQNCNL